MSTERWQAIKASVAALGRAHVRAGVVGPPAQEPHGDGPMTNGEIALVHELGSRDGRIPERSFVRSSMRDPGFQAEFAALQARLVRAVLAGLMSRDRALGLLGALAASEIQQTITDDLVEGPALAPETVRRKGSDKLLVDHGELAAAVGWEIVG